MAKPKLIDQLGGEQTVQKLVECFYDLIESHPRGRRIFELHMEGHGVAHSRVEQFNFLCGFMGGRNHYLEKHHHMNLKLMHEHLSITENHADDWLFCMNLAMDEVEISPGARPSLEAAFARVATVLVNGEKP